MMIICYYAGDAGPHGHWHSAMLLCLEQGNPLATAPPRELGRDPARIYVLHAGEAVPLRSARRA